MPEQSPAPQTQPPPSPGYLNNNGPYGLATFRMSTGVNITVSVVIAAALAVAIIAGYIRIRRQRRAHQVSVHLLGLFVEQSGIALAAQHHAVS